VRPAEARRLRSIGSFRPVVAAATACLTLVLIAPLAGPAQASEARVQLFYLARQPVRDALLDVALQARVSLGGDLTACSGLSPRIDGRMSLDAVLSRTLAGSGCRHQIRRDGAVMIRRAPSLTEPVRAPTAAAPPETVDVSEVGEIVVTAPRRPELIQGSSSAMTAVDAERISFAGVADMQGLDGLVSGMTVTNLGPGRNKIFLRGVSDGVFTGLTQSTVGLYLDQAPITYSAPDPDLKLIDIDRVEVLRGPQGTLYGTGPIGGVVRIVTRRPEIGQERLDVSLTRSHTRYGGDNSDYSLVANVPFPGDRAAIRTSVYRENFSGYINDVELNLRRVNDGRRQGGRFAAIVDLAPGWTAIAGAVRQSIDTQDTHYVYRGFGPLRRANLVREPHRNSFDQASLAVEGRGEWGRLDASLALVEHGFESRYDASSALRRFGSPARIGALDERKDIRLLVGEATWASPETRRWRWLVGGLVSSGDTWTNPVLSALRLTPEQVYAEDRRDRLDEVAAYGEISIDLRPDLTLTAGARAYALEYETTSEVRQRNATRAFEGRGEVSGLTPKLALAWRMNDRLNLSAQASQGHRAGGFNTAGVIGQDFTGQMDSPSREYKSDSLWNFEIDAKARSRDGRARLRAAVFVARWRDVQSDQFLPSGLAYVANVGDGLDTGIEVEADWQVTEGLSLYANALVADPRITDPDEQFGSRRDAALPGVPRASANLNFAYRRPLWDGMDLIADGGLSYVGSSRLTFDGRKLHSMGDYATARLALGVEAAPWTAVLFVDNLFDTEANTFAYSDPFRLPDAQAITPLRPLTAGLTLRWSR